ncbi:TetR/AcrR family transcriptional regulator [Rhodococcus qingshengii]|uniref:TetR/AcrR family transcriptional regulator n=1 Tax=Rhodococcus qingshengii TaxID=334542 RepID=UPI0036D85786
MKSTTEGEDERGGMTARLVRATLELLAEAGPAEIKARRITDRIGVSTVAIYHHFGGLNELLEAVVNEGYSMLRVALEETRQLADDPSAELFAMALATRDIAQRNPHLYDMMFGLSIRGTYRVAATPDSPRASLFASTYAVLVDACRRLVDAGRTTNVDADQVAAELWSLIHGFVTLEAVGHFNHVDDPADSILAPMAVRHLVGMGDEADRATRGAATARRWWLTGAGGRQPKPG